MAERPPLKGILVPVVTPMDEDERIDEEGFRKVARFLMDAGVHGIFVLGSVGEGASLREVEKDRLLAVARDVVPPTVALLAGTMETGTARALDRVLAAERAGADYAVVLLPCYHYVFTPEEARAHFLSLGESSSVPLVLYNLPQRTSYSLTAEIVEPLVDSPRFHGIKDSSTDWETFEGFLTRCRRPDFTVHQGDSWAMGKSFLAGTDGAVPSTANALPAAAVACYEAAQRGETERVGKLSELLAAVRTEMNPLNVSAAMKASLASRGLCGVALTRPVAALSQSDVDRIAALVDRYEKQLLSEG